jgi:hypothetical protein
MDRRSLIGQKGELNENEGFNLIQNLDLVEKVRYNRQIPGWCAVYWWRTLLRLSWTKFGEE